MLFRLQTLHSVKLECEYTAKDGRNIGRTRERRAGEDFCRKKMGLYGL